MAVGVVTTEPPVGDASDAFKDRRLATAPLVGRPLGSTIADMVVNRQEKVDDEGECADGRPSVSVCRSDESVCVWWCADEGADDDDGDGGEGKWSVCGAQPALLGVLLVCVCVCVQRMTMTVRMTATAMRVSGIRLCVLGPTCMSACLECADVEGDIDGDGDGQQQQQQEEDEMGRGDEPDQRDTHTFLVCVMAICDVCRLIDYTQTMISGWKADCGWSTYLQINKQNRWVCERCTYNSHFVLSCLHASLTECVVWLVCTRPNASPHPSLTPHTPLTMNSFPQHASQLEEF